MKHAEHLDLYRHKKHETRDRNLKIPVIQQQLKHEIWGRLQHFHPHQSAQKQNTYQYSLEIIISKSRKFDFK